MPGESVIIDISYVENLKYEDGQYEFVFPMTVGPRYIPGSVVDASRISPPVAATRTSHDVSIQVNLNAGVPIESIRSSSHQIAQTNLSAESANVSLANEKTIPNKDFILRYDVSGKRLEDGILTHRAERGGFFTLMLQPPDTPRAEDRTPKEIVFVLDTSGSMHGFPIEKAKEAMRLSLDGLYPSKLGDLFSAKPVIVNGRFAKGGSGTIKLKGKLAGQDYVREIPVSFPENETANDVLATLWARKRIDELSSEALNAKNADEINKQITGLGLEFRLLTSFTSFVAVEERIVNSGGIPTKVLVPVEIPEGVNRETTVGGSDQTVEVSASSIQSSISTSNLMVMQPGITAEVSVSGSRASKSRKARNEKKQTGSSSGPGIGGGIGSGSGMGVGSGSGTGSGAPPPSKMSTPVFSSPGLPLPPPNIQGPARQISGGVMNGKATSLPKLLIRRRLVRQRRAARSAFR